MEIVAQFGSSSLHQAKMSVTMHRRARRIDVGSPRDVFLQNIVLYGSRELFEVCSLLTGHGYVKRQKNCRRGIDGHGGGYMREGNAFEECLHVFERADGYSDFPYLAPRAR